MADDSMEISSDHGGLNADDDIDIDIDFTAGPADDDDHMFEDQYADPDTEFKEMDVEFNESYEHESAPQGIDDEVMIDDYTESFQMEETRDEDEQFQDISDEVLHVVEAEVSEIEVSDPYQTERKGSNHSTRGSFFQNAAPPQGKAFENVSAEDDMNQTGSPYAEGPPDTVTSTAQHSPKLQSGLPSNANSPSSDHLINEASKNSSVERETLTVEEKESHVTDYNTEPSAEAAAEDEEEIVQEAEDLTHSDEFAPEIKGQTRSDVIDDSYLRILVSYLGTKYALFSSPEDQNTDSFFFDDPTMVHQPLSLFLKALRDILGDEVKKTDELFISIKVLGLEFGETSREIDKKSFEDLIKLYQDLLRNDGIKSPPEPLDFTLAFRSEFATRISHLVQVSGQGKGLSDIDTKPEGVGSESYDAADVSIQDHDQLQHNGDETHLNGDAQNHGQDNAKEDFQNNPEDGLQDYSEGGVQDNPEDGFQDNPEGDVQDKPDDDFQYNPEGDVQENPEDDGFQYNPEDDLQDNPEGDVQGNLDDDFQFSPEDDFEDDQEDAFQDEHLLKQDETATSAFLEENVEVESNVAISSVPQEYESHEEGFSMGATDENEDNGMVSEKLLTTASPFPTEEITVLGSENLAQSKQAPETLPKVREEQSVEEDLIDYTDDEEEPEPVESTNSEKLPLDSRNAHFQTKDRFGRQLSLPRSADNASTVQASPVIAAHGELTNTRNEAEETQQKPANDTYDADEIDFNLGGDDDDDDELQTDLQEVEEVRPKHDESSQVDGYYKEVEEGQQPKRDQSNQFEDYYTDLDEQELGDDDLYNFDENIGNESDIHAGDRGFTTKSEALKVVTSTGSEIASLKSNGTSPHEEVSAESVTVSGDTIDEIDYEDEEDLPVVENPTVSDSQSAQRTLKIEDLDEITYEDDEDDGNVAPQTPDAIASQYTSNSTTPGKRQRSDSMSEGEGNQDAKRVKS